MEASLKRAAILSTASLGAILSSSSIVWRLPSTLSKRSKAAFIESISSLHFLISARFETIRDSFSSIFWSFVLALSSFAFSSASICSCNILTRPSMLATFRLASFNSLWRGIISSSSFSIALSTRMPFENRLMISFLSLSEQERKSWNLCLERTKLLYNSSLLMPSFSKIYLSYSLTLERTASSVSTGLPSRIMEHFTADADFLEIFLSTINSSVLLSLRNLRRIKHPSAASLIISSFLILRSGVPPIPIAIASIRADFPEPFDFWESLSRLFPNTRVVTPCSSV